MRVDPPDTIEVQILDTVLGLSLTPATAECVLVAGRDAGGAILGHDDLDIPAGRGVAAVEASTQAVQAVLQTRASAAAQGQRLAAIGVTWTDEAAAQAALVLEKLTDAGLDNVVAVRYQQAAGTGGAGTAQGAALVAAGSAAFTDTEFTATEPTDAPPQAAAPPPRSLQYAGALTMVVVGALTFVVSLSLAVSLQRAPDRDGGPIERVANTSATEPLTERVLPPPVHRPAPAEPAGLPDVVDDAGDHE